MEAAGGGGGNSLLCCENGGSLGAERLCKARRDPALLADRRVLTNLLGAESRYRPAVSGYKAGAGDIRQPMRRVLAYWMVEVCDEQGCQDAVFPLAMNLLDRFLAVTPLQKTQLQLVGAVCLLIGSKLRETRPLTAATLVDCADRCFDVRDVMDWELLVLHRLRWEVSAVTSHDFLEPLLERLPLHSYLADQPAALEEVRQRAQIYIILCGTEYQFTAYSASTVASASIAAALRGGAASAAGPGPAAAAAAASADCLERLQHTTGVGTADLRCCLAEIESTLCTFAEETSRPAPPRRPTALPPGELPPDYDHAGTPTDVREVHF